MAWPGMDPRIPEPTSADGEAFTEDDALKELFQMILEKLADTDAFSQPISPSVFIVYAHDNVMEGIAHADCVRRLIEWLGILRSRTLSDKAPLPLWTTREGGTAAAHNILSNQFCLLPASGHADDPNTIISVDKVVICTSALLERYYKNDSASRYISRMQALLTDTWATHQQRNFLQDRIREFVEAECQTHETELWFHHVLTELAFLSLRYSTDCHHHGIIPVSLDGVLPTYLPFVDHCDLVLKRKASAGLADQHKLFFNLLGQVFEEAHEIIAQFGHCYETARQRFQDKARITRNIFKSITYTEILKAQETLVHRRSAALRMEGDEKLKHRIEDALSNLNTANRKTSILKGLVPLPYQDRKDRNPERERGTCKWFTEHRLFRDWQESKTSKLLWVSADPGCGKSVLAKYLVDQVLLAPTQKSTCYFFFKDDFEDQRNLENAFRCLLHQIFIQRPTLFSNEILKRFQQDGQLLNSFSQLWDILINVAKYEDTGEIVCVLDALDECEQDGRTRLMTVLSRFYKAPQTDCALKFLITSRQYFDIYRGFRSLKVRQPIIHLSGENENEAKKISQEIDIVIRARVREISMQLELEKDEQETLLQELVRVENRTYLWAALMFDIVKNSIETSKQALKDVVRELPRTVSAAYEKILNRSADHAKTRRVLHIILAARRPLSLEKMATALAVKETHTDYNQLGIQRSDRFRTTIKALCGLFVIIADSKVYLLHQTAKEFLIQDTTVPLTHSPDSTIIPRSWEHSFDRMESDRIMAEICIWYLGLRNPRRDPFLDYAARNWMGHFRTVQNMKVTDLRHRAEGLFDPGAPPKSRWIEIYGHNESYRLIFNGFDTGLMLVSWFGLESIALLLLEHGADVDAQDKDGQTPLSMAVENGHKATAQLLLEHGAAVDAQDRDGQTPLSFAAQHDYKATAQLLLEHGAAVNTQDRNGQTPLSIAAQNGCKATAQLLLEHRAAVDEQDEIGRTPLSWAAHDGDKATVQLLLKHKAAVNLRDIYGRTPLFFAEQNGCKATAQLLLEHGAAVNIQDGHGQTPLSFAVENGYEVIGQL